MQHVRYKAKDIFIVLVFLLNLINCLRNGGSNDQNQNLSFKNKRIKKIAKQPTSPLTDKIMSRINTVNNPLKYGANYLVSGRFLDDQEESNLKNTVEYISEDNNCLFSRENFLDYLNVIREKHSVSKISWNMLLENELRIYARHLKNNLQCEYIVGDNRYSTGEIVQQGPERLTEKEVLQKWYEPAYGLKFGMIPYYLNYDKVDRYPLSVLLWDDTKEVACVKVCCAETELVICRFFPVLGGDFFNDINKHIKPNKYIKLNEQLLQNK